VPTLPEPRGPLTAVLRHELCQAAQRLPPIVLPETTEPLADEDLQLALYLLYELHYRGFDGVDERWEWEPSALALRGVLEDIFEGGLYTAIGPPDDEAEDVAIALRRIASDGDEPSPSEYLEREGTREQFRELVVHASAHRLKAADRHAWAIPRLSAPARVALARAQLFAASMTALGLDASYGAYLDVIPARTLAAVNLMSLMGLHRRWRGGIAGQLALGELKSSAPNAAYGRGLRRLGLDAAAPFFDDHSQAGALELADGLAREEPELTGQILWGARALAELDARAARDLLDHWERGITSLAAPIPSRAPA
jgi:hypothetical protein